MYLRSLQGTVRQRSALFWWVAALAILFFAFGLQEHYARFPRGWLTDDAYFYPQIARHLARSGLSSFDGIHTTDGYHLAWGWMLAIVSWLAGRVSWDSGWQLGWMVSFYLLLSLAMARMGRNRVHALWLFATGFIFKMMMETTLLALTFLVLARDRFLREPEEPARWTRWCAVLLLIMPMIRIDAVLIGSVGSLGQWMRDRDMRALGLNLGLLAGGLLLQFATMKFAFGHWLSVSAEMKASSLNLAEIWRNVQANVSGDYLANLLSWVTALAFWGVAAIGLGRPRDRATWSRQMVLAAPLVFVVFHLLTNNTLRYWYFVPLLAVSVWMSDIYPSRRPPVRRVAQLVFAGAVLTFFGKSAVDSVIRREQIRWSAEFVNKLKAHVGPETPVFQIDASGYVAWHSDLQVINGDGLVNTHDYARRLHEGRLATYLEEEGIRHIVSNQYPSRGFVVERGELKVPLNSVEVLVAPPSGFPPRTAFGLYRLR